MIRYLGQEEYGKCLPLWQEAFPEDSQAFLGYYFNKKLPGSRVLVKEDGSGSILTMAHLNPYTVMVRGRRYRLSYLVGVATGGVVVSMDEPLAGRTVPGLWAEGQGVPGHASGRA